MKTALALSAVLGVILLSTPAQAKDVSETAKVVTMNSVPCSTKGEQFKETREPLCNEYVLRSGKTEYHIQQKKAKHAALLAVGQQVTFTIHGDRVHLQTKNARGKETELDLALVLMTAAEEASPPNTAQQQR